MSNIKCEKQFIFKEDLCKAMLSANIPLPKLNNKSFRNFLMKYTNKNILDESTFRKNYICDIKQLKIFKSM